MNNEAQQSGFSGKEGRSQRLQHWKAFAVLNFACTLALAGVVIWTIRSQQGGAQDLLRVHRIAVIDDAGKERIVIAAPLKEPPIVNGREGRRRVRVSAAVQFKDADGTERGGIALEEDGSFLFGIDDEHGNERAHLFYIPERGSGVYLQSPAADTVALTSPPSGHGSPSLQMLSSAGATIDEWPSKK